ncbi:MAG: apolipoprotein N-acyltransferase [Rhodospirillales bacterium 69-11]|jgi:apolipoprotein N-acyltransferase|nr:apolipoprotein N-acyltransferase [Rhodospirillales bacterium]OJW21935.1 MAG: apolipoprotein N-acyltransferase [Rhodospirillales bacterium 69-11]
MHVVQAPRASSAAVPVDRLVLPLAAQAALAPILGSAGALALAPLHLLPFLVVAFSGLFCLLHTSSWRRALLFGWLFGAGHFAVGLAWIGEAFQVDAARFGVFALPAVALLALGLAVFSALACASARLLAPRGGWPLLPALAAGWGASEWLRGHVLTGFPWNLVGYAWGVSDATLQGAAVLGIYGLGVITVLLAALPGLALVNGTRRGIRRWWPLPAAALGMVSLWAWGAVQLAAADPGVVPGVRLRLVQAGVPQRLKWDPTERERIFALYRSLSSAPPASGAPAPTHLIWPETALPWALEEMPPETRASIAHLVPPGGALLVGAVRWAPGPDGRLAPRNSVVALGQDGTPIAAYDKARLVPFGEYVPGRELLPAWVRKLTPGDIDFMPGPGRATLAVPGLPPTAPLICYEAIFPAPVSDWPANQPRPAWLLSATNDGWFGRSWGPYQHLLAARVRAVELGLPLVRAASTGISIVTDARGRVLASLPLGASGTLDTALPAALPGGTAYARWGDSSFELLLALSATTSLVASRHRSRRPPR